MDYQIKAPAKLNLGLKVTGRRPDGYHDLVSVMVPIDLVDHLEISLLDKKGIGLSCEGHPVPEDQSNLVHRAVRAFLKRLNRFEGVSVRLTKNIPVAAGLGGGSSDAAATLLALNELYSRPLTFDDLEALALRLGADVPFFLYRRPSIARGIGEILEPIKRWPKIWYVIIMPPIRVSTSWAYGKLKLELTSGRDDYIKTSLKHGPSVLFRHLENDLETVTSAHFPIIGNIKEQMKEAGAICALMSGSGPSVFGVFSSQDGAIKARNDLIAQDLGEVYLATNWEST